MILVIIFNFTKKLNLTLIINELGENWKKKWKAKSIGII